MVKIALSEHKLLGQHLFVRRGTYSHHGIYAGNDEVVHYSGFQKKLGTGKVSKVNFKDFSNGKEVFVRVYFQYIFSPEEIVERAISRINENEYHLLFNNCEHFACWCISNKEISSQLNAVLSPITGLSRAIGRGTIGWAFSVTDKYLDVRMNRYLKSYRAIMNWVFLTQII
ncbi:MAG: lecithin retinol acyltransferase family protein [Crocosphaera sp.]